MTDFATARRTGNYRRDGMLIQRLPAFKAGEVLLGKACEITFAATVVVPGRYAIVESSRLQPSHVGGVENPYYFIPEAQPRNRATSRSGALMPELAARNVRPAEVAEGATAYAGAPIVNLRGEVIQGNGRAYMLMFMYRQFPDGIRRYRAFLEKECDCYGFSAQAVKAFASPVLVRLVDVSDEQAIRLGQYKQEDLEAVATSTNAVKSRVGKLDEMGVQRLLNELESADNPDATLAQTIRASNPLRVLVKEGVIRSDELEKYTRGGDINEEGVRLVSGIVTGLVFRGSDVNTPEYLEQLPASVKQVVEKSTLALLRVRPAASINREVSRAIAAAREYSTGKESQSFRNWLQQYDLSGTAPVQRYKPLELKLAEVFVTARTQREAVYQFKEYALKVNGRQGMLMDNVRPMTKAQAVLEVWGVFTSSKYTSLKPVAAAPAKASFRSGVREVKSAAADTATAKARLRLLALKLQLKNKAR